MLGKISLIIFPWIFLKLTMGMWNLRKRRKNSEYYSSPRIVPSQYFCSLGRGTIQVIYPLYCIRSLNQGPSWGGEYFIWGPFIFHMASATPPPSNSTRPTPTWALPMYNILTTQPGRTTARTSSCHAKDLGSILVGPIRLWAMGSYIIFIASSMSRHTQWLGGTVFGCQKWTLDVCSQKCLPKN